jgi:hypothetical protein
LSTACPRCATIYHLSIHRTNFYTDPPPHRSGPMSSKDYSNDAGGPTDIRGQLRALREEFDALVRQRGGSASDDDAAVARLRGEIERLHCAIEACCAAAACRPASASADPPVPPYPPFPPYPPYPPVAPFPPYPPYPPNCGCCAPAPCGCAKCSGQPASPAQPMPQPAPPPPPALASSSSSAPSSSSGSSWRLSIRGIPQAPSSSSRYVEPIR